jgi:hypothetical protein
MSGRLEERDELILEERDEWKVRRKELEEGYERQQRCL